MVQILLDSQRPRWVVEHHCCPRCLRSRQQRFRDQGLFLDLVLDLCLSQILSQRTFLLKGLVLHVLDVVLVSIRSANISSSTCTSKNAHLIITFVTLVVKDPDIPSLDFASLSPSVPLISGLPSHWSKMALPSSSEITPASSSGSFSSRKSSYSKAASASLWLPWQVAERGKQLTFEQKFRQELEHEHPTTTWSLWWTTQLLMRNFMCNLVAMRRMKPHRPYTVTHAKG